MIGLRVCDVCTMLFISYRNHRPSDIIITYVCTYVYSYRPKVSDGRLIYIRNEVNVYIVYYYINYIIVRTYTHTIVRIYL